MTEIKGNIWDCHAKSPKHWSVISTNGFVKQDGSCVMGRGIALEAARKFKALPRELGSRIKQEGNHVFVFPEYQIITFPVKHVWWEAADIGLIARSACELVGLFGQRADTVAMPRVGCANGRLLWSDVQRVLTIAFTDWPNVTIVDRVQP